MGSLILPFAAILILFFVAYDYTWHVAKKKNPGAFLKGCCALVCMLVFVFRAEDISQIGNIIFTAAMVFVIAADVVICFRFKEGVIFFGLAHIMFAASFVSVKLSWMPSLAVFFVFIAIMLYLVKRWKLLGYVSPVYLIYPVLLAVMVSLSVGVSGLLAIGAAAFAGSDLILIYNRFVAKRPWIGRANLALYFCALFILAIAYV